MKKDEIFKTKFQADREARDMAIYNEYNELMKEPGAMICAVSEYLCGKYGYYRHGTIPVIVKRVEKRLEKEDKL
ncbi:MAG: hypothetical protein FWF53_05675 [Candidatus Azobacteroides sp.]|nr:hypothetical protein [Candidatus Azobacteroides sp.]